MTLPSSGLISLGAIDTELDLGATVPITMNDASVRALAGVLSGKITIPTDFYGKSNTPAPPASGTLLSTYCSGYDKYGTYADGSGGTYAALIAANSADCGYVALEYFYVDNGYGSSGNYYWFISNGYINYGIYNGFYGRSTQYVFSNIYDPTGTNASTDISPVDPGDGYLYYRGPIQVSVPHGAYYSIARRPK